MEFSYFLDSRLRGNDTLGLARLGEASCFMRLKCYPCFSPVLRSFSCGESSCYELYDGQCWDGFG